MELIRHIYPKFSMTPGLLLAPGWTQKPNVGIALAAKCEEINGVFTCECILDIDTAEATKYTDCNDWKNKNGYTKQRVELDKLNNVYKVNGVDLLAKIRKQC